MSRAFVLGAGASAFAGYPLGPDLWQFLRDSEPAESNTKEAHAAVMEAIGPILRLNGLQEQERPDLEKLHALGHLPLGSWPRELETRGLASDQAENHAFDCRILPVARVAVPTASDP